MDINDLLKDLMNTQDIQFKEDVKGIMMEIIKKEIEEEKNGTK